MEAEINSLSSNLPSVFYTKELNITNSGCDIFYTLYYWYYLQAIYQKMHRSRRPTFI